MRLFIAINFDEDVIDDFVRLQEELKDCGVKGNFTRPENLHLTFAFIGEYGDPDDVLDVMENVTFKPIPLKFEGLQHFRDMYFARIENDQGLESYARKLRRALSENSIPFDRKRFSPHVTLVRKVSFRNGALAPFPENTSIREIMATRISLMRSERGKRGMVYTEIGAIKSSGDREGRETHAK